MAITITLNETALLIISIVALIYLGERCIAFYLWYIKRKVEIYGKPCNLKFWTCGCGAVSSEIDLTCRYCHKPRKAKQEEERTAENELTKKEYDMWACPQCKHVCYGWHENCPKCTTPRPVYKCTCGYQTQNWYDADNHLWVNSDDKGNVYEEHRITREGDL